MQMIVDLGYLTFKMAFGSFDLWQMKYGKEVTLAAVDNKPNRKNLYPEYKQYRNSGKEELVRVVWELRKQVETEKVLPLCSIEGLEADDLVACWYLFNQDQKILGVDKDFFQLPNLEHTYYHNLKLYSIIEAISNLPQYVQHLASNNFALYQILLGDVADNIPRLLSKGKEGKQQITRALYADDRGFLSDWLLDTFGEQARINAALVLLPYYEFGDFDDYAGDWFKCWSQGHYYDRGNWWKLYNQMRAVKLENTVAQNNEVWDLFSLM